MLKSAFAKWPKCKYGRYFIVYGWSIVVVVFVVVLDVCVCFFSVCLLSMPWFYIRDRKNCILTGLFRNVFLDFDAFRSSANNV